MGLGKVDCAILVYLDADSKEVRYIFLNCEVKASILHVLDNLVELSKILTGQDGVTSVQDIDALASCENTFISVALMEPNGLELVDKVLISNSACLFLSIDILVDLKNIVTRTIKLKTLWNLHVHVTFDFCLGVCHNKVNLLGMPALDNGHG